MARIQSQSSRRAAQRLRAQAILRLRKQQQADREAGRPDGLGLLDWTKRYRAYLGPEVRFDLDNHKYLAQLFAQVSRYTVIRKASQVGVSEYGVSRALWSCETRDMNVFYVMPTQPDVYDFSQMRIGPAIEASPLLASLVVDSNAFSKKRGADRALMKRIRNRFFTLRGAAVTPDGRARGLKSVPADLVIRDEVDEMDHRVAEIVRKRLAHSRFKEELAMSTPTFPGIGIDQEWAISDQRYWHVPCPKCGEWVAPTLDHVILDWDELGQPSAWHGKEEGRAYVACSACGGELNRNAEGEWIPTYLDRDVAGYHMSRLVTPNANLLELVLSLMTTNESTRKEIYNQDLAEPYMVKGGQISDDEIDACRRDYLMGNRRAPVAYAGIDVGRVLHVVIRARPNEDGDRPLLWAGDVANFSDLTPLFHRFNVKTAVVDALPETRKAREFQNDEEPNKVWLCYYTPAAEKKQAEAVWNEDEGIVQAERTRALDAMYSMFYSERNVLPADIRDVPDYYDHLKASVRVTSESKGKPITTYINSRPDHFAHAEVYCYLASLRPKAQATTSAEAEVAKADDFFE